MSGGKEFNRVWQLVSILYAFTLLKGLDFDSFYVKLGKANILANQIRCL